MSKATASRLTIFNARVKERREAGPGPGEEGIDELIEVIKRRRMVHAFTAEPLAPGTVERLLRAANRAPSAGFSQGYTFLVLGRQGGSRAVLAVARDEEIAGYYARAAQLAPPDMLAWLHSPGHSR